MALDNYYETFYLQEPVQVPDGFGGLEWKLGDGAGFMGLYNQDDSSEMRIAEAQGVSSSGTFVTGVDVPIKEGDTIRRASDDLYLKVTGKPINSPKSATSQFQKMNVQKTVRST